MAKKMKKSKMAKALKMGNPSEEFLIGLMIGGSAAYVLSDEKLRGQAIRYAVQTLASVANGVEELKEQVADIQAEIVAEHAVQA